MTSDLQRFLGVNNDASPREVLGLGTGALSSTQIQEALRTRLAQIMAHPEGRFESAQAVKNRLREAAELLSMEVARVSRIRQHVSATRPSHVEAGGGHRVSASGWRRSTPPIRLTPFDRQVLAVLVGSGGWNKQSRARLVALSTRHQVTPQGLHRVIDGLANYARAGGPRLGVGQITDGSARMGVTPREHVLNPAADTLRALESLDESPASAGGGLRTVQLSMIFGVVTVIAGVLALQAVLSGPGNPPRPIDGVPAQSSSAPTPTATRTTSPAATNANGARSVALAEFESEPDFELPSLPVDATAAADQCASLATHLDELARQVQVAEDGLSLATLKGWEEDISRIATGWVLVDDSTRREALQGVREVLRAAADQPAELAKLLDALTPAYTRHAQPTGVWQSAWRSGALAHVAENEEASPLVAEAALQRLRATLLPVQPPGNLTFISGARAGMKRIVPELLDQLMYGDAALDACELWIRAHAELGRGEAFEQSMLYAARELLLSNANLMRDGPARQLLGRLMREANLARSPVGRKTILEWYADEAMSAPGLWVLTSLLHRRPDLPWFDASNVIGADADMRQRRRLNDQLARLWPVADDSSDRSLRAEGVRVDPAQHERWTKLCDAASTLPALDNDQNRLLLAVVHARLSEVAAVLAAGEIDQAELALQEMELLLIPKVDDERPEPVRGISLWISGVVDRQARVRPGQPIGMDGQWAAAYEASRNNAEERLKWLQRLQTDVAGDLGPIDAESFVRLVYTGSPQDVRTLAQAILTDRFASGPNVALEMVNQLRNTSGRDDLAQTIEKLTSTLLPSHNDPDWLRAARQALVEHAISLRRAPFDTDSAVIDALAERLAASCAALAARVDGGGASATAVTSPDEAAALVRSAWRAAAGSLLVSQPVPASVDELDRRSRMRAQHADGAIQRYVAAQVDVMELMVYVIAAEQPALRDEVARRLSESTRRREAMTHVLDQLIEVHEQILRLWQLRIHGGQAVAQAGDTPWA